MAEWKQYQTFVEAMKCDKPMDVGVGNYVAKAYPGDYICRDARGMLWIVPGDVFDSLYVPAGLGGRIPS